jgi:hypothetical protein
MAPLFEDDGSVAKNVRQQARVKTLLSWHSSTCSTTQTIWQAEVQFLSGELANSRRDNLRLQESLTELKSKVDLEVRWLIHFEMSAL